jgi:hypothetical protein
MKTVPSDLAVPGRAGHPQAPDFVDPAGSLGQPHDAHPEATHIPPLPVRLY